MAMSLATLEILEEALFPPAQARAIARALETDAGARRGDLATKEDLLSTRQALKTDITDLRHELKEDISELRQELKGDISELRQGLKGGVSELRLEFKSDLSEVRHGLEVKMESTKTEVVRWVFLAVMGQSALFSGLIYFLSQNPP